MMRAEEGSTVPNIAVNLEVTPEVTHIKRLQGKSANAISIDQFLEALFKVNGQVSLVESSLFSVQQQGDDYERWWIITKISKRVRSKRLSTLDALQELLELTLNHENLDSFKNHLLICLFGPEEEMKAAKVSRRINAYIKAIQEVKKEEVERIKKLAVDLINDTEFFTPGRLESIFSSVLDKKKAEPINEESTSRAPNISMPPRPSASSILLEREVHPYAGKLWQQGEAFFHEKKEELRAKELAPIREELRKTKNANAALYKALTLDIGKKGPHSAKFGWVLTLIKEAKKFEQFFGEENTEDYNRAVLFVDCFIGALNEIRMDKVKAVLEENIKSLTVGSLQQKYQFWLEAKEKDNAFKEDDLITQMVRMAKDGVVGLRNQAREKLITPIIEKAKSNEISPTAALCELLTLPIGKEHEHSFKYFLLQHLFALDDKYKAEASEIVQCFIQGLDLYVRKENRERNNNRISRVKRLVDWFANLGLEVAKGRLTEAHEKAVKAKNAEIKPFPSDSVSVQATLEFVGGLFKSGKSIIRGWNHRSILDEMNANKIEPLLALYLLLESVGEKSQNSFKYKLLADLFSSVEEANNPNSGIQPIKPEDARDAEELVKCFSLIIAEKQDQEVKIDLSAL